MNRAYTTTDREILTEVPSSTPVPASPDWPQLKDEALHGVPGEIVRAIDPFTEADPVAVLTTLLLGFGNLIGDGPHFSVEFDRHPLRTNAVLVGDSSKARKGASLSAVRRLLKEADPDWESNRIVSGLSSGEGLIFQVRDPSGDDLGVIDKRLFVIEEEFASVLQMMRRDGNVLGSVIRQAWDSKGALQTLTKNNFTKATGAHISILGHITSYELLKLLSENDQANGFANRFLWLRVRRTKCIDDPVPLPTPVLKKFVEQIQSAREFAESIGEIKRDPAAARVWSGVYAALSEGKPFLTGALRNRAESQVMRLACVYATMDSSPLITPDHLKAALALWDYVEASIYSIFGDRTGDETADRIIVTLKDAPDGLDETALHQLFGNNLSRKRIQDALDILYKANLVDGETQKQTGGRPRMVWRLRKSPPTN